MKFNLPYRIVLMGCLVLIMGCFPAEPKREVNPNGPKLPPPPTPQEIAQSIIDDAQLDMKVPRPGTTFPKTVKKNLISILKKAKNKHARSEDGKKAIQFVSTRIDKRIREFQQAKAWSHVLVFLEAREVFEPDNRQYSALKEQATTALRRPIVKVRGLSEMNGIQFVILSFTIPLTDEKFTNERLRMGDNAHGIKVLGVFGQSRGVMLEYMETGEKFVALLSASE